MSKRVYVPGYPCDKRVSVSEYVSDTITHDSSFYDEKNGIEDRIERIAETLGRLVDILHAKGALADADVLNLVGEYWHGVKIVDEPDESL